jgi:hypothetical protein
MKNLNIGYIVEETNRLGASRSKLYTSCPWHALAEWLVKSYKPMGFPPGTRIGSQHTDGDLVLHVKGESVIVGAALLSLEGVFRLYDEEVRAVRISTELSMSDSSAYYTSGSADIYLKPEYDSAISKMKDKLNIYCRDQIDAGYILAQFAANDHMHPFWKPRLFNRVRGLSM